MVAHRKGARLNMGAISRKIGIEAIRNGSSALDVMIDNMLFWHGKVGELTSQISNMVLNVDNVDERREAYGVLRLLLAARENSQRCAVDLAPYMHPKLQSIQIKDDNARDVEVTMNILAAAAQEEDRSYRDGYDEVKKPNVVAPSPATIDRKVAGIE
jgi:hypothetical protein